MAAGQGFKTFTTGEVLTAGDVNGYLMQGINVFASNAARDAAITSPQEGQFAYTKDTNSLWYYTGSAWAASGATGDIEGVSVTSPITGGGTSGTVTIGIDSTAVVPSQTGNAGKYLSTNGTVSSWQPVASGGITWTQKGSPADFDTGAILSIAYNGSNLYVVTTDLAQTFTSPDLVTWTSRTTGFGANNINNIIYANGLFVAVGITGLISTSANGITWTMRTANVAANDLYQVIYANSLFVAVGAGANGGTGGITTSADGITWTKRTTPTTSATTINSVAFGNGYFLAVGGANTRSGYYSTDGITWTVTDATLNINCAYVTYQDGKWLVFSDSSPGGRWRATNPTGTFTSINGAILLPMMALYYNRVNAIAVYDNKFYFSGASNNNPQLGIFGTTVANNSIRDIVATHPLPISQFGSSSNVGSYFSVFVTSTGGIIVGRNGCLFTSF